MSHLYPQQLKRQLNHWSSLLSIVMVFTVVCSSALLLMPILLAAPAADVSAALAIVAVAEPQIHPNRL
jgi:hypothetical protein